MTPSDETPHDPAPETPAENHEPLALTPSGETRPFWSKWTSHWHLPVGAIAAIALAAGFGLASVLSVIVLGDESGYEIGDVQKTKLAAIEAFWETRTEQPFHIAAWPDRISFVLRLTPTAGVKDGTLSMSLDLPDGYKLLPGEGPVHAQLPDHFVEVLPVPPGTRAFCSSEHGWQELILRSERPGEDL